MSATCPHTSLDNDKAELFDTFNYCFFKVSSFSNTLGDLRSMAFMMPQDFSVLRSTGEFEGLKFLSTEAKFLSLILKADRFADATRRDV